MDFRLSFGATGGADAGVNFFDGAGSDILVHVALRPGERALVLNSRIGGNWGRQIKCSREDLAGGIELELELDGTRAALLQEGRVLLKADFPHAFGNEEFRRIETYGAVTVHRRAEDDARLRELIAAAGFATARWLLDFDAAAYLQLNPDLAGRAGSRAQALQHFLDAGIRELRPYAADEPFDPVFYCGFYADQQGARPEAAYAHWVRQGRYDGRHCCESALLAALGLGLPAVPEAFDAALLEGARGGARVSRWQAFVEWSESPAVAAAPLPFADPRAALGALLALARRNASRGDEAAARALFWRAAVIAEGQGDGAIWDELASLCTRTGAHAEAVHCFRRAVAGAEDDADLWRRAQLGLSRALLAGGLCGEALQVAGQALAAAPECAEAQECHRAARAAVFRREHAVALGLALGGDRDGAVAAARAAAQRLTGSAAVRAPAEASGPLPGRAPRVLIFGEAGLPQCLHYRVQQKLEHLAAAGIDARFVPHTEPAGFAARVHACDLVIFYRVRALPEIVEAIELARGLGLPTCYEIDDLLFDPAHFPGSLASYGGLLPAPTHAALVVDAPLYAAAIALCDVGIASTPSLQQAMVPHLRSGRCFLHRNGFSALHEALLRSGVPRRDREGIELFYGSGTRAHNEDFEQLAAPAIATLMLENPAVRLVVCGYLELPPSLTGFGSRVVRVPPVEDYACYLERFVAQADINLAVLSPGLLSDCKSEIKWLEAAVFGVPSVVSATATCRELLQDGDTAMLASTPAEWLQKLRALVADAGLRMRIGARARAFAAERYAVDALSRNIAGIVGEICPASPAARRARVLVVNAPLQAAGERAASDALPPAIAALGADSAAAPVLSVFGIARDGLEPLALRTGLRSGVRCTLVGAGAPEAALAREFATFLRDTRPDLVHFHRVDALSPVLPGVARDAGIPVVIDLDDAWWVAGRPQLVDPVTEGSPAGELDLVLRDGAAAVEVIGRRRHLLADLAAASALVASTAGIEALYRGFGLERIRVIEPGSRPQAGRSRTAGDAGAVRLGVPFATAMPERLELLDRVLAGGRFGGLQVRVADGGAQGARGRRSGARPAGAAAPDAAHADDVLLDDIDVLLVLLPWPEPCARLLREALERGIHVIGPAVGVVAELVVEGENGLLVDTGDAAALAAALRRLEADPARYRAPHARAPRPWTLAQQAAALEGLYAGLLGAGPEARPG